MRARLPLNGAGRADITRDPDIIRSYLEDAAHFTGGHAGELVAPANEAQLADALRNATAILTVGAQSSLTGGATPMGETIVSTKRLTGIEFHGSTRVRVGAGVTIEELITAVESAGHYYPPAPTFKGAFVGGTIATNAAGAATFKYGATRDWVESITVMLPSGDVLDMERGATRANGDGFFELQLRSGTVKVPAPGYRTPRLPKLSAGYFAAPQMDLVDLFIGSEGTLGVITSATLRILAARPAICVALVPFPDERAALKFTRILRDASRETWRSCCRRGVDVAAIEYIDDRSLAIIREDGADVVNGVSLPASAHSALLVALELPPDVDAAQAFDQIGRVHDAHRPDTPLIRFCRLLLDAQVLDDVEVAVPGDAVRAAQFAAIREAVPAGVNQRVGRAKQDVDHRIEKVAADIAVPFDRLEDLIDRFHAEAKRRGLHAVVWGHASDANLHPNVIARSYEEMQWAKAVVAEIGRIAIQLGGAPMAEHGVGRNPIKQQLLRDLYGADGIEQMRSVKRAVDPDWKLAPGVLFSR